MTSQAAVSRVESPTETLITGLMELLHGQTEGWELSNYDIQRSVDGEGRYVQLSWLDGEGIGRSIALEVATSQEIPVSHVSVGMAVAYFTDDEGKNVWRQSHYEHGGFATSPLMALTLVNHLYNLASSWTRQDIAANQLLPFSC